MILALARAMFGVDLALPDFPMLKSVRGLGFSDSDIYANRLSAVFTYTNTFYHREPFFDLTHPDENEFGKYDFVICSDVLEHVPQPLHTAFQTLACLLKPTGILILTMPYSLESSTIEHFSDLRQFAVVDIGGKAVLVNKLESDGYEVHDNLIFHNGPGRTLEMRILSEQDIRAMLRTVGLAEVLIQTLGSTEFGIAQTGPCSLPILARKYPFALSSSRLNELVGQWADQKRVITAIGKSRWLRLGRWLSLGPDLVRKERT